ncbi:MAG TPA: hypothetical protein VG318_00790 [Actinomycetota bacterium]|nr:hypothetical protein [Actinomycetota bacterium]
MADNKTMLQVAKGLRREPTYLFGFSLLLTVGAVFINEESPLIRFSLIVVAFGVTITGMVLVEGRKRRSIPTASVEQKERLADVPAEELAIRGLFGALVANDRETYFVYSSTVANELRDHEGNPIQLNENERHVTTIFDVRAISKIHSLLDIAGKKKLLQIKTAANFPEDAWGCNLILIGSRNANPVTEEALEDLKPPFRFSPDMKSIVAGATKKWPADDAEAKDFDFAIVAKLTKKVGEDSCVRLVAAGIGAVGTLGACHYLQTNVVALHQRFGGAPFACVVRVDKSVGFTSAREEACEGLPG